MIKIEVVKCCGFDVEYKFKKKYEEKMELLTKGGQEIVQVEFISLPFLRKAYVLYKPSEKLKKKILKEG